MRGETTWIAPLLGPIFCYGIILKEFETVCDYAVYMHDFVFMFALKHLIFICYKLT
jgi:hypothetical protein